MSPVSEGQKAADLEIMRMAADIQTELMDAFPVNAREKLCIREFKSPFPPEFTENNGALRRTP